MKKILSIALALSMLTMAAMPCMVSAATETVEATVLNQDFSSATLDGTYTEKSNPKTYNDGDIVVNVNGGANYLTVADGILKLDATKYTSSKWYDTSLPLDSTISIADAAAKGMTVTTKFDFKAGNADMASGIPAILYITLANSALNKATATNMPQIRVKKTEGVYFKFSDTETPVFSSNFAYGTTYSYVLTMQAKTDSNGNNYWEGVSMSVGTEDCTEFVKGKSLGTLDYGYFSCYATSGTGHYYELDNVSVTTSYEQEVEEEGGDDVVEEVIASNGYTFVGEYADGETDTAVALGYGFESADAEKTEVVWTVTNDQDVTGTHTQKIGSVTGGATLKVGLVIQGLTQSAVKTVTAVLQ